MGLKWSFLFYYLKMKFLLLSAVTVEATSQFNQSKMASFYMNQLWLHKEHVCKEFATKTNISQEECERKNPLKLVREQTWAAQSVMQHWIRKVCYAEELKKDGEGETYFQSGMLATDDPKIPARMAQEQKPENLASRYGSTLDILFDSDYSQERVRRVHACAAKESKKYELTQGKSLDTEWVFYKKNVGVIIIAGIALALVSGAVSGFGGEAWTNTPAGDGELPSSNP